MGLFPLADSSPFLSISSSARAAAWRARARRADVVWWRPTSITSTCPAAMLPSSDDDTFPLTQARRARTGPAARVTAAHRCIRRARAARTSRWAVAALAERGPPPADSRFTP